MKTKVVHMQYYDPNGIYYPSSFCMVGVNLYIDNVEATTKWDKCTCKSCLKKKENAGEPK